MKEFKFIQVTPEQLQQAINDCLKPQLEALQKQFQPKEPTEYLERSEVAKMLNINLSTLHNWSKQGILKPYGIGRRVYYKRKEVESAIVELKKVS